MSGKAVARTRRIRPDPYKLEAGPVGTPAKRLGFLFCLELFGKHLFA